MGKSSVDHLKAARALIADSARWTQGFYAFNAAGRQRFGYHQDAVCFCAFGALQRASGEPDDVASNVAGNFLSGAAFELFGVNAARVNDELGHASVLRMFDRALAKAEGR